LELNRNKRNGSKKRTEGKIIKPPSKEKGYQSGRRKIVHTAALGGVNLPQKKRAVSALLEGKGGGRKGAESQRKGNGA